MKVYIASKLHHAVRWKKLRIQWAPQIDLHARWFDQAHIEQNEKPSKEDFKIFWQVDAEDVANSDALIIYGEKDEVLRGALIEAGIAIANNILVLTVGDGNFGTWRNHPCVVEAVTLEYAKTMLLRRFR